MSKPKFKVGDNIIYENDTNNVRLVTKIKNGTYTTVIFDINEEDVNDLDEKVNFVWEFKQMETAFDSYNHWLAKKEFNNDLKELLNE